MQKTEFFHQFNILPYYFQRQCMVKWLSHHAVCKIGLTEFYEQQNLKRPVNGKDNKRKLSQYLAALIFVLF